MADAVLGLVDPFDDAALQIGRIDGNWLTGLRLYDVTLVQGGENRLAHADTLRLRYRLLSLLGGTIHVREAVAAGLDVEMTQQPDSTWDLLSVLRQDTTAADTSAGFAFVVDRLRLRNSTFTAHFYNPRRDSTLRVQNLAAGLDSLRLGGGGDVALVVDHLRAGLQPPGQDYVADLRAEGRLVDGRLTLKEFAYQSPRTDLTAEGTAALPNDTQDTVHAIDFRVRAAPVALADLHPFVPALDSTGTATLDARLTGTTQNLTVALDGALSDGATLDLDATFALGEGVAYQLDGRVQDLDPNFFLADDFAPTRLSGTVRADLRGDSLEVLDGTARLRLTDARYGEYALDGAVASATFRNGTASLDLETALRGARFDVDGTVRPFAAVPTYDLRGQVSSLDLGRFTEGGTQSSDITGTFRLEGRGFAPDEARATATVQLAPSRINRYTIQDGRLTATLADGDLRFDTALELPEGAVAARGTADLGTETLTYRIDEGSFRNLDLAALTGDTTRSSLTGTFSLRGSGTDPATDLRLDDLRLTLDDSYYGTYDVNDATLTGRLRGGRLDFDLAADLEGGDVDVAGTARPFDGVPTYTLTRGTFADVDIGELTGDPTRQSDLTGRILRLDGRGFDPRTAQIDAELELSESSYNRQQIDAARLTASLRQGLLDLDATLETPEGQTRLAGQLDLTGDDLTFALAEGTLTGLNLGALLGIDGLDTALSGTVDAFDVRGTDPETMRLLLDMDLSRSRINRATVEAGSLFVSLDDGFARLATVLTLEEGSAVVSGSGALFAERPTYEALGRLTNVDVAALAGLDTTRARLTGAFGLQGEGFDPETMRLDARVDLAESVYDSVRVDTLATRFTLAGGVLALDTLAVASNVARVRAGGPIALFDSTAASDFRLRADLRDPGPLRGFIGADVFSLGGGEVTAHVHGPPGSLLFDGAVSLRSLIYNDVRLAGLEGSTSGRFRPGLEPELFEVRAEMGYFSLPALTVQDTDFEAVYQNDEVRFSLGLEVDTRRDARLSGRIDLRPESQRFVVEALDLRFDDDRWELLQEASVTYGDAYRVSGLLLYSDDQQVAVDGVIDLDGEQSLVLTIENFRIGAVADLLEFRGLDGTLDGSLVLTGPAVAPNLEGTLAFDVISFEQAVGDLDLAVRYDSLRLHTEALLTHVDGSTLALDGFVPLDLRLREPEAPGQGAVQVRQAGTVGSEEVNLELTADRFNIGWIEPFLDPETVREVEGRLTGGVTVTGTFDRPLLAGEAMLGDARLALPALGVEYTDVRAEAVLADNQVQLAHLELHTGDDGSLIGHGTIDLAQLTLGQFDLEASADEFRAIDTREYRIVTDADLRLRGTTEAPVVTGTAELLSADIYLTETTAASQFGPVQLTEADVQMLENNFGLRLSEADTSTFDLYEAMTLDLDVQMERDVWLRSRKNPDMNIQFTGELDLTKAPYAEERIFGTIEVIPERSYLQEFGRRFNLESGTLTFNGPATNPYLDLAARYDVRSRGSQGTEIAITLGVEGRLDDLDLELTSNPPTDQTNIVSYLATGRPADKAFRLGGTLDVGTDLALSQLTNVIENAAGSELGLDVIEIRQEGLQGATITAGKYLSRKFYASVSWPINFSESATEAGTPSSSGREFTVEYELFYWLLARLTSDGTTVRVNLLYEYAY
ncbi:MAG: translocation/assembly module TamB [Rhodothermales bacterium]|nr:translocation/assembly module TamB [Rhodothermales bacterium]